MGAVLLFAATALAAWWLTRTLSIRLTAVAPLTARNYRGLEVPTATGIAVVFGVLGALGLAVLLAALMPRDPFPSVVSAALIGGAAVTGFGLLGLWDDLMPSGARGWAAHVRAIRRLQPTGGAMKLVGGVLLGLVLAAAIDGGGLGAIVLRGALIAMSANLVNLLDLRPGRALKFASLLAVAPLAVGLATGDRAWIIVVAVLAASLAFLPVDLAERAMLGDVGANAIGAALGTATVAVTSTPVEGALVVGLLVLHLLADRPGLSRLIAATPPLAALDRVGRAPERSS